MREYPDTLHPPSNRDITSQPTKLYSAVSFLSAVSGTQVDSLNEGSAASVDCSEATFLWPDVFRQDFASD